VIDIRGVLIYFWKDLFVFLFLWGFLEKKVMNILKNSNGIRFGVLKTTSSKCLVIIGEINIFFIFKQFIFHFRKKKKLGSGLYVFPVIPYFFGNFPSVGPFRNNTHNLLTT